MKNFFMSVVVSFFLFSFAKADENSSTWQLVGKISEKCDFIGNAELLVNYSVLKIKVEKSKFALLSRNYFFNYLINIKFWCFSN